MEEKHILKLNFGGEVIEHDFSYMKILEFTKPNVVSIGIISRIHWIKQKYFSRIMIQQS